ncbi:NAD(P)H dehydrogenase B4 [Artemisia annua]|uniref:NAD(P)H dehydrogenase B4 n=1 Tax=Artemisia annua TaxID=35608 RepID=A0A2U1NW33_ARTAN|nr:NAD(P)H dehydrogenase B4 [Artemisia annua]
MDGRCNNGSGSTRLYLAKCFNRMKECEQKPDAPIRFRHTGRHHFKPLDTNQQLQKGSDSTRVDATFYVPQPAVSIKEQERVPFLGCYFSFRSLQATDSTSLNLFYCTLKLMIYSNTVTGPGLLNKYVGEKNLALRTIVSHAKTCFPRILCHHMDSFTTLIEDLPHLLSCLDNLSKLIGHTPVGQREATTGHFNIFVGDLSLEVTDAMLYAFFSVCTNCMLSSLSVPTDDQRMLKSQLMVYAALLLYFKTHFLLAECSFNMVDMLDEKGNTFVYVLRSIKHLKLQLITQLMSVLPILLRTTTNRCIIKKIRSRPRLCYWTLHLLAILRESIDVALERNNIDFLSRCQVGSCAVNLFHQLYPCTEVCESWKVRGETCPSTTFTSRTRVLVLLTNKVVAGKHHQAIGQGGFATHFTIHDPVGD